MISFFPVPYPDELWYSVICRYHVRSGNYCAKHTMQQLYGDTYRTPSLMITMTTIAQNISNYRTRAFCGRYNFARKNTAMRNEYDFSGAKNPYTT